MLVPIIIITHASLHHIRQCRPPSRLVLYTPLPNTPDKSIRRHTRASQAVRLRYLLQWQDSYNSKEMDQEVAA